MSANILPPASTASAVPLKVEPIPSEKLSIYESDSKVASSSISSNPSVEGASSIHAKPGTLTDKFKVLTEATQQKLEPAIKLVQDTTEKLVKKMPDSVTNHEKDHRIYQERQEQRKIEQSLAAQELGAPVNEVKPLSLTSALKDVGQHVGETIVATSKDVGAQIAATSKDLSAKAKVKYSEWKAEKSTPTSSQMATGANGPTLASSSASGIVGGKELPGYIPDSTPAPQTIDTTHASTSTSSSTTASSPLSFAGSAATTLPQAFSGSSSSTASSETHLPSTSLNATSGSLPEGDMNKVQVPFQTSSGYSNLTNTVGPNATTDPAFQSDPNLNLEQHDYAQRRKEDALKHL